MTLCAELARPMTDLMPFLVYDVQRMHYATPISYNKGWNAFATSRFLLNGPLYPALTGALPVTPWVIRRYRSSSWARLRI
jgi:hypothetical protein